MCDQNNDEFCNRVTIRFEFRKINPETGELTNDGITNLDLYDPRGDAKHDGTVGNILIDILTRSNDPANIVVPEADRAVWETEPKENVELDIYYEATHALPMKLKEGNALSFAPLKSAVNVIRTTSDGEIPVNLSIEDTGNYLTYTANVMTNIDSLNTRVGGIHYAGYTLNDDQGYGTIPIIKVISDSSDPNSPTSLQKKNIGVGDWLTFTHSSGLVTKSKVVAHYDLTGSPTTVYTPQPIYGALVEISENPSEENPQGVVTITIPGGSDLTTGVLTGMNIHGDGVPTGVQVLSTDGTNITLSDTSWMSGSEAVYLQKPTGYYAIEANVWENEVKLGWHNCYSFGNGVESDRIRDDFNAPTIDNGVRVSATVDSYGKEDRTSGLIFSGLYNTTSGVNDLNEFNMGENIIKNLNPAYGTVQALKSRDTDVVVFCEDKILKVLANKEAVFNADGNKQLTATDRVLGNVSTFKGDYGISKNPESLSWDQYRMYFTDTQRGAVLRLSMDGLTPISNVGMKTWFRENLRGKDKLLGTFDTVNGEYNLTITPPVSEGPTISFNEGSKGWVSFKSFAPDEGISVSGRYITVKNSGIFKHYVDSWEWDSASNDWTIGGRNLFYGTQYNSTLTVIYNDSPGQVKSFKAINYEGSQARIDQDTEQSESNYQNEYYNIFEDKDGWWVSDFKTDLQDGQTKSFVDK